MRTFKILFLAFITLIIGLFIWYSIGSAPVNSKDTTTKIFVIKKGEGLKGIANSLRKEGLIRDELVFILTVKRLGIESNIQAGDFRLSPSIKADEIANLLTHGTLDRWITIIEGWRAEETVRVLEKEIETYDRSWILELKKKEGYLFPDTYLIPKDADIPFILNRFQENFDQKITDTMRNDLKKQGRTLNEAIILASLIEREAKFADDRPKVASVFFNRLEIGMKLDVDATVQYALGFQEAQDTWWKKKLTSQDLKFDSPFNTYLYNGLPPKPITNPGLSAIKAAIYPAETDFLYYLSDKNGHIHFAQTFEEHKENIERYL